MAVVTLPARCDRAAAEALLPEFIAAQGAGPIEIDAREVTQLGHAMLQLLVSARRSGDGALIRPSQTLRETAVLTGLERALLDGEVA